jgi:hypothetical protein
MKKLLVSILFALSLCVSAFAAPLDFVQASTVDASHFTAGATAVKTIRVLSIDYQNGVCRFQLLDASGNPYGSNGGIFGINDATLNEGNAQAKILALITS